MNVAPLATEPATRHNAAALLIEHDLVELIARIEALRLPADIRGTKLRVGPVELDLIERTPRRGDRSIDLLPREFRLLEYMMRRQDQILTRDILLREVWRLRSFRRLILWTCTWAGCGARSTGRTSRR
jgi:hypothetical protein